MSTRPFIDTNPDCAICLELLSTQQTLTLTCGHIYHLACLISQLQHTQPTPSKRLLFSGTRCAQCQAPFHHPLLQNHSAAHKAIEAAVDTLILQQVRVDGLPDNVIDVLEYGKRIYAFYVCFNCGDPYFGGRVDCGDAAETELRGEERLCFKCSPRAAHLCKNGAHWPSYSWKCRFCCKKATFVCYGGVHFCDDCHDRDGQRRARGERELAAIPCQGAPECELGGLQPGERHKNGIRLDCELLLSCTICDTGGDNVEREVAAGSGNFLRNSSGDENTAGWTNFGSLPWRVERPPMESIGPAANFVSGYVWCCMVQVVDLARFVLSPAEREVEVSARYMGRTDCPSVFRMVCTVFDERGQNLEEWDSGILNAPPDGWELLRHVFGPSAGRRFISVAVYGKDTRFWHGDYGSKVANISLRLLFEGSSEGVLRDVVSQDSGQEIRIMSLLQQRILQGTSRAAYRLMRRFHFL